MKNFKGVVNLIYQLRNSDYGKVSKLIENTNHELCIDAVITGNTPGEIYVDNVEESLSTLIITPECNVVAGNANNQLFNEKIKKKLDFFDTVTCDTEEWERKIHDIHCNVAIRKYKRRYYQFDELLFDNFLESLDEQYTLEYVYVDTLDQIVCWCLVDCIVGGDRIEIGITAHKDFRRRGLGSIALAATVSACISNGVKEIGWHCVDTNVGSYAIAERVGFKKIKEYSCFTPYPPIENVTDLNDEQWSEWAMHYEQMNKIEPKYYGQAARCWGLSNNIEKSMLNIKYLVESEPKILVENILDSEEFTSFQENEEWKKFINDLSAKYRYIMAKKRSNKMKVITLCGSTKFKKQFEQANAYLTLQGNIVISLAFFEQSEGFEITQEQAELFERLHFRKIDMSDEIFVIDVDGYIGSSTKKEIKYAKEKGKTVRFYSKSGITNDFVSSVFS
jgi:RimJ/RimL family protein N-acetyltransferase/uncharacterized protein YkuJ